jgi:phage terminase small subunit
MSKVKKQTDSQITNNKGINLPKNISKETATIINSIINQLSETVINESDALSLSMLARNYELMIKAYNDLTKRGIVINDELNLNYGVYKGMMQGVFNILNNFGLNPKSRKYIPEFQTPKEKTQLETFLSDDDEEDLTSTN